MKSSVVDQFHDPGFGTLRQLLHEHPDVVPLVKTASIDADERDTLPSGAFAWESERRFPVHTPAAAVLSALYVKTAAQVPSEVREIIRESLSMYGIPEGLLSTPQVKHASYTKEDYLFPEAELYPVTSPTEVKLAESRLLDQIDRMTVAQRAEGFTRLAKKANQFEVTLKTASYQYAGAVETDLTEVREQIQARAAVTKLAEVQQKLDTLDAALKNFPRNYNDRKGQAKLAQYLSELDRQAGFEPEYDRRLRDPVRTVFNTNRVTKVAAADMIELGDYSFPSTQLGGVDPSFYGDVLGPDFADEVAPGGVMNPEKLAQVLVTLPADMKQQLGVSLCQALGQR